VAYTYAVVQNVSRKMDGQCSGKKKLFCCICTKLCIFLLSMLSLLQSLKYFHVINGTQPFCCNQVTPLNKLSHSAGQGFLHFIEPRVHYFMHTRPSLALIHLNPVHTLSHQFFWILILSSHLCVAFPYVLFSLHFCK